MMPVCVKGVLGECFIRQRKRLFSVGFWMGIWNGTAWMQQVREKYEKFRLGLVQESLGRDDYIWATKALSFLRPHWWQDYEDQRALENALLKTQTLALKTKN